jgi:hypothetical protein
MTQAIALLLLVFFVTPEQAGAQNAAPRSESWQTLTVPDAHLDLGEVYHVFPGEDAQLICVSDAPLQRLAAINRRVVGYLVVPFDRDESAPLIAGGALRIPVAAFETGSSGTDDLLLGESLLDSSKYPEITCLLVSAKSWERDGDGQPPKYRARLAVRFTVKDKTIEKEIDAAVALRPFTWQTMGRYPGELLTFRTTIELGLDELGLKKPGPAWGERLADTLRCDLFLLANTVPPDKTLDPAQSQSEVYRRLKILTLIRDFNRVREGRDLGRQFIRAYADDAQALNRLAMDFVAADGLRGRGLDVALEAAEAAMSASQNKDAAIMDTLAQLYWLSGRSKEALSVQRKAVEQSATLPPAMADELRSRLERYEAMSADGEAVKPVR